MIETLISWVETNEQLMGWLVAASLLLFLASIIVVPILLVKIPRDYFAAPKRYPSALSGYPAPLILLLKIVRNILGALLILVGLVLLLLPGQGLLMILAGVVIADVPGKHRALRWLVYRKNLARPINWLRAKADKAPLAPDPRTTTRRG